jgi:hypothetical protein
MLDPSTSLHYAPNANIVGRNTYAPGVDGFNLADVSNVDQVNALPPGVKALVYLGMTNGADAAFQSAVTPFINNPKVYGFYIADEPRPSVPAANLQAESDWIHTHVPGAKTFIVLENNGTPTSPSYSFNPANTGIDLFGLDPYPIRPQFSGGENLGVIPAAVQASGIKQSQIVPVYQAFGGGGYSSWTLPTPAQEQQILQTWGPLVPNPAFDYAYSWGVQSGDTALATSPALQQIFAAHNGVPGAPPPPAVSDATITAVDRNAVAASIPVITAGTQDFTGLLAGSIHQSVASGVDSVTVTAGITTENVQFGAQSQTMAFLGGAAINVRGGSGTDVVTAAAGANSFTAGTGTLDVTGGSGKNTYIFHAGGGLLRIEDFSLAKGDVLTVDRALRTSPVQETSDGHGGVMLTFGPAGHGVDLVGVPSSSFAPSNIHFV